MVFAVVLKLNSARKNALQLHDKPSENVNSALLSEINVKLRVSNIGGLQMMLRRWRVFSADLSTAGASWQDFN